MSSCSQARVLLQEVPGFLCCIMNHVSAAYQGGPVTGSSLCKEARAKQPVKYNACDCHAISRGVAGQSGNSSRVGIWFGDHDISKAHALYLKGAP